MAKYRSSTLPMAPATTVAATYTTHSTVMYNCNCQVADPIPSQTIPEMLVEKSLCCNYHNFSEVLRIFTFGHFWIFYASFFGSEKN